jgi:uncharacterized protein (TIGR04222 family)
MEWLTHNLIADMHGPAFLFFYAAAICLTLVACRLLSRRLDWTASMPLPPIPSAPDPHEIAYLRGGENEAARSVIFALIQRDLLQVTQSGSDFLIEKVAEPPQERGTLKPVERSALEWFGKPQPVAEVFQRGGLTSHLAPFLGTYEQRLRKEQFLTSPENSKGARLALLCGALLISGLGVYKLLIAFSRGRFNVLFLVIMGAAGLFLLFKVCRLPRLSGRGQAYLERLHLAFDRLKYASLKPPAPQPNVTGEAAAGAYAFDPSLPLIVGLFGVGALAGTPYDFYQQPFQRSALSTSGDGSASYAAAGCGSSSSSSSGSGGSSCSSGGSSCGSSCGGGCGGCGS